MSKTQMKQDLEKTLQHRGKNCATFVQPLKGGTSESPGHPAHPCIELVP